MTCDLRTGDALTLLRQMPDKSVDCCVTSPPYWRLRNYNVEGQYGMEATPKEWVAMQVQVFREVRRIVNGTLWLNVGDSYVNRSLAGGGDPTIGLRNIGESKQPRQPVLPLLPKNLLGLPWMLAFALRNDGWYLRQEIIWQKPQAMPESCKDRPTRSHEQIFLLAAAHRYYYDWRTIQEPAVCKSVKKFTDGGRDKQRGHSRRHAGFNGRYAAKLAVEGAPKLRNKRSVWTISTQAFKGAHFATFPEKLVEPCILAGCPVGGTVLDPYLGSGTTGLVALRHGRHFVGIDLKPEYVAMARERIAKEAWIHAAWDRESA
jgi:DNA modification methylase